MATMKRKFAKELLKGLIWDESSYEYEPADVEYARAQEANDEIASLKRRMSAVFGFRWGFSPVAERAS
jgi:hypothetical protein